MSGQVGRRIRFCVEHASLLYCIPQPGTDLQTLVWCYTFINRTGPPTYVVLGSCLSNALAAGIIAWERNRVVFLDDWFDRIHVADATTPNEIESMLMFEEVLLSSSWERKVSHNFTLSPEDYEAAIKRPW